MADIFISYARTDRDKVLELASALSGNGYDVWWDREIAGGIEFSAAIEREAALVVEGAVAAPGMLDADAEEVREAARTWGLPAGLDEVEQSSVAIPAVV